MDCRAVSQLYSVYGGMLDSDFALKVLIVLRVSRSYDAVNFLKNNLTLFKRQINMVF